MAKTRERTYPEDHAARLPLLEKKRDLKMSASTHATSKRIHVPSWLWQDLVDLVAVHERAYLEHCRQHALSDARASRSS